MIALFISIPFISILGVILFANKIGRSGSFLISLLSLFCTLVIVLFTTYNVLMGNKVFIEITWFEVGQAWSTITLKIDELSSLMQVLISFVGFLVFVYSYEYLLVDKQRERYELMIVGFVLSMFMLVLGDSILTVFIGWEGVGILQYGLISFWYTVGEGTKSSLYAVFVNRIGDVCILIGATLYWGISGSFSFTSWVFMDSTTIGSYFILIGCLSKSAQLGLHIWLPDAMQAPTPISALLHAATMVTAGVYLVIKLQPLWTSTISTLLILVGLGSVLVCGSIGLVASDMKKVIAYSTGSQLGYMFLACGLGVYNLAFYHLFTHGFFKSLLFLQAGIVIHSVMDDQDIRSLGGLRRFLPLAYCCSLVGTIALLGLPFLSGYYSKDLILEVASQSGSLLGYIGGLCGVLFTSLYSTRLLKLIYLAKPKSSKIVMQGVSESGGMMSGPVILLSFLAIIVGYTFSDLLSGEGSTYLSEVVVSQGSSSFDIHYLPRIYALLPFILTVVGIVLGSMVQEDVYKRLYRKIYSFLVSKWLFDIFYNEFIVYATLVLSHKGTYITVDKGLLERFMQWSGGQILLGAQHMMRKLSMGDTFSSFILMVLGLIGYNCLLYFLW